MGDSRGVRGSPRAMGVYGSNKSTTSARDAQSGSNAGTFVRAKYGNGHTNSNIPSQGRLNSNRVAKEHAPLAVVRPEPTRLNSRVGAKERTSIDNTNSSPGRGRRHNNINNRANISRGPEPARIQVKLNSKHNPKGSPRNPKCNYDNKFEGFPENTPQFCLLNSKWNAKEHADIGNSTSNPTNHSTRDRDRIKKAGESCFTPSNEPARERAEPAGGRARGQRQFDIDLFDYPPSKASGGTGVYNDIITNGVEKQRKLSRLVEENVGMAEHVRRSMKLRFDSPGRRARPDVTRANTQYAQESDDETCERWMRNLEAVCDAAGLAPEVKKGVRNAELAEKLIREKIEHHEKGCPYPGNPGASGKCLRALHQLFPVCGDRTFSHIYDALAGEGVRLTGRMGFPDVFREEKGGVPELSLQGLLSSQEEIRGDILKRQEGECSLNRHIINAECEREVKMGYMKPIDEKAVRQLNPPAVFYHRFVAVQVKQDKGTAGSDEQKLVEQFNSPRSKKCFARTGVPRDWTLKRRCADDGSQNGVNNASHVYTPINVATLDRAAASVADLKQKMSAAGRTSDLVFVSKDQGEAYRSMRVSAERTGYHRVVVTKGPDGHVKYWLLGRLSYGEVGSVLTYNVAARVAARWATLVLFALEHYYDDFIAALRQQHAKTGDRLLTFFMTVMIGFVFNPAKGWVGERGIYLGMELCLGGSALRVGLSENREKKLLWHIDEHLRSNEMKPAEANRLCGKLNWSCNCLMGKCGRSKILPIRARANRKRRGRREWNQLNHWLRDSLLWWRNLLSGNAKHLTREINLLTSFLGKLPPVLIYTDASEFGLGIVVIITGADGVLLRWAAVPVEGKSYREIRGSVAAEKGELKELLKLLQKDEADSSSYNPDTAVADTAIAILETEAINVVFQNWGRFISGCMCNPYEAVSNVDSNTALSAMIRGCSNGKVLGQWLSSIANDTWTLLCCLKIYAFFTRVSTGDNPSDDPSRLKMAKPGGWVPSNATVERIPCNRSARVVNQPKNGGK